MNRRIVPIMLAAVALSGCGRRGGDTGRAQGYDDVVHALQSFVRHERAEKGIPGLSLALVDSQRVVWAAGFGWADSTAGVRATPETVYRVGSVSKLFTDIAIMRLVERGELDLDAPIQKYLPSFEPRNPFGGTITIRELSAHRAGLTREPPVGSYFDDSSPTLAQTVASLNQTTLLYAPGSHTKYSNAGIAVLGYVLQKTQGASFYPYLKSTLLDSMGLHDSAFQPLPALEQRLAKGYMWSYDGKFFDAPTFQLGMGPCGSMYSTVLDLARFERILFAGGVAPDGPRILQRKTLDEMWTPQFAPKDARTGYGIGFHIGQLAGHRVVGHDGAIYGFATTLTALPDDGLGVVVIASLDGVNATTDRIANAALRLMLARREHRPLPALDTTTALGAADALRLQGRYLKDGRGVDLKEYEGHLYMMPTAGGLRSEVRRLPDDSLVVDGRLAYGPRITPLDDGRLVLGVDTLSRVPTEHPAALVTRPKPKADISPAFHGLIGEYGWPYETLYIFEKDGRLHALIEWFFEYPLKRVSRDVYAFPDWGLYDGQKIVFERDADGQAQAAIAANVTFKRIPLPGDENGVSFRITPVKPVSELRTEALKASPPAEKGDFRKPDLVELRSLDPTIKYDIRYATTNNFMGHPFYTSAHAFMQRPAAEAVARVSRLLRPLGYGLLIHDAYRPWYVTKMFWDGTPVDKHQFVADPSEGSHHNRGCAVDLTLYDLKTGRSVRTTGGYDEMSERSYPLYPGGTNHQRWLRDLLRHAMESQGFTVYEFEWWHFDYKDWQRYPILNITFEQLASQHSAEGSR
ncbi:MAG: serine hydrolase [Gemmatimonadota bacterium]